MLVPVWNYIIALIVLVVLIVTTIYGLHWIGTNVTHDQPDSHTGSTGHSGCTGTGYPGTIILAQGQSGGQSEAKGERQALSASPLKPSGSGCKKVDIQSDEQPGKNQPKRSARTKRKKSSRVRGINPFNRA